MTDQPTIDPLDVPQEFQARLSAMLAVKKPVFSDMAMAAGLDLATDFRGADLRGVDFTGSNLEGFDFAGADLRGATGLSFSSFLSESRIFKLVKDHAEAFTSFDWASDISSAFKPKSMRDLFKELTQGAKDDLEAVLNNVIGARFTDKGQRFIEIPNLADTPYTLPVSPDGAQFAAELDDGRIGIWDSTTGLSEGPVKLPHDNVVLCVCYSPDGNYIVVGDAVGSVNFHFLNQLGLASTVGLGLRPVFCVDVDPSGGRLVAGTDKGFIAVLEDVGGQQELQLLGHRGSVNSVTYSPTGDRILSCGDDGTARLWDTDGAEILRIETGLRSNQASVFSPDGDQIAIGGWAGNCLSIWDAQTGAKLKDLIVNTNGEDVWVNDVRFSPCGRWLAAGYGDNIIRIWDWQAGQEVGQLIGHSDTVNCVSFSPDGTRIFSGSADHSIRIWFLDEMLSSLE